MEELWILLIIIIIKKWFQRVFFFFGIFQMFCEKKSISKISIVINTILNLKNVNEIGFTPVLCSQSKIS